MPGFQDLVPEFQDLLFEFQKPGHEFQDRGPEFARLGCLHVGKIISRSGACLSESKAGLAELGA